MPVKINSIEFYSELFGVSDEPVDWLLANVGDKIRIELSMTVSTFAICSIDNTIRFNAKDGYLGAGWVVDTIGRFADFRVGDTVSVDNYITDTHLENMTIVEKIDDNIIRFNADLTAGGDDNDSAQVVVSITMPITAVRYKYNFIENSDQPNFLSKISGTEQILFASELDASDTTPVNMEFLGELSYQIGSATIQGDGISAASGDQVYESNFTIIHEAVITPFMLAAQRDDLIDDISPDYFFNTKALKGVFDVEAMYEATDPNRIQTIEITEVLGNTGWFNENFNTGLTNYSIDNLAFEQDASGGDAVDAVILSSTVKTYFEFDIENAADAPFVAATTNLIINFIKLPEDEEEYSLNGRNVVENFIFDRVVLTLGDTNEDGEQFGTDRQIFENVNATFNSSGSITIDGLIDMSAAAVTLCSESETPMYAIWVTVQDESLDMNVADKVSLLVSKGEFEIQTEDANLVQIENKFIRHPEEEDCTDFPEPTDPDTLEWAISNSSGSGVSELYSSDTGNVYGVANWTTDLNTTMALLVTSVNTNTPQGTVFGGHPFDNSVGMVAAWDIPTQTFSMSVPVGSGATFNINMQFAISGGIWGGQAGDIHTFSGGLDPVTSVDVFPEDEVVAYSRFYIDKTDITTEEVVLTKITCRIKAKNTSTLDEFTLEEFVTDVTNSLVISDNQYFDIETPRVFHIPQDEIRKTIRLYRREDLDTGDLHYYDVSYPFMIRWEYWKKLALANSDFFDTSEPNNGWNQFWHRYTTEANWGLYYELEIRATKDGTLQEYNNEAEIISNDYESNAAEWSPATIKTYDIDTLDELYDPISGKRYISGYKNTLVEAHFTNIPGPPDIDNITVVFGIEAYEEGGIDGRRRFSSVHVADLDTWFLSCDEDAVPNNTGLVRLEIIGDLVVATALIDYTKIPPNTRFSISARIYDFVSACS